MTTRRRPGRAGGAYPASGGAGGRALVLLLFVGLTAVGAVTTKAQCVDAAREGALAAARGEPGEPAAARIAPTDATIAVSAESGDVTVVVHAPIRILGGDLTSITVRSTAVAAMEPSS